MMDEKNQWRHGTDLYSLPFLRKYGLASSLEGSQMRLGETPRLYTSKSTNTALTYSRDRELLLPTYAELGRSVDG